MPTNCLQKTCLEKSKKHKEYNVLLHNLEKQYINVFSLMFDSTTTTSTITDALDSTTTATITDVLDSTTTATITDTQDSTSIDMITDTQDSNTYIYTIYLMNATQGYWGLEIDGIQIDVNSPLSLHITPDNLFNKIKEKYTNNIISVIKTNQTNSVAFSLTFTKPVNIATYDTMLVGLHKIIHVIEGSIIPICNMKHIDFFNVKKGLFKLTINNDKTVWVDLSLSISILLTKIQSRLWYTEYRIKRIIRIPNEIDTTVYQDVRYTFEFENIVPEISITSTAYLDSTASAHSVTCDTTLLDLNLNIYNIQNYITDITNTFKFGTIDSLQSNIIGIKDFEIEKMWLIRPNSHKIKKNATHIVRLSYSYTDIFDRNTKKYKNVPWSFTIQSDKRPYDFPLGEGVFRNSDNYNNLNNINGLIEIDKNWGNERVLYNRQSRLRSS